MFNLIHWSNWIADEWGQERSQKFTIGNNDGIWGRKSPNWVEGKSPAEVPGAIRGPQKPETNVDMDYTETEENYETNKYVSIFL